MLHEFWREYTVKELNSIKREKCLNCPYSKRTGSTGEYIRPGDPDIYTKGKQKFNLGNIYCDYFMMTNKRRDVRPENCRHYKDKKVRGQ